MNNVIGFTIGDIDGIGIEILIKFIKNNNYKKIILISNILLLQKFIRKNNINIKIIKISKNYLLNKNQLTKNILYVYDIKAKNNIDNTYNSLKVSYKLAKQKLIRGIVTLPLNKEKIIKKIDKNFIGQTEFFQIMDKKKYVNMVFIHKKLIIVTLTTHVPLSKIFSLLSNKKIIFEKIKSLFNTLKEDLDISNPNIAISGINPHAGENSTIGKEEIKYLMPVIKEINLNKLILKGPFPADSILSTKNIKLFSAFIFTYHDQALIPFKLLSKNLGVNYTSGLDIIRVSPDHGTAYDIVGKNIVKDNNIIKCINLIEKISKNRK
tara:strand:- start:582 stop:1547 length:966 start_codon:yes stop_codon:yes gene_type:complete